jgi:hypothetical protein
VGVLPPGREAGVPIEGQSGSLAGEAQIPATDQHEMFDPTPPAAPPPSPPPGTPAHGGPDHGGDGGDLPLHDVAVVAHGTGRLEGGILPCS